MGYTEGEWKAKCQDGVWIVTLSKEVGGELDDFDICDCDLASSQVECEANAHLIAAAPDMYEALKNFGLYVAVNYDAKNKPFYYIDQEWLDKRTQALAKAEGK